MKMLKEEFEPMDIHILLVAETGMTSLEGNLAHVQKPP